MTKSIPITLITGYLGSGKTTLLNHLLNNQKGYKIAVIVNDIGEVNIDEELIAKEGIVTSKDDSLVPLQNGCICCTLKTDLINQINDIIALKKFDYIIIEASGICEPVPIAQTICAMEEAYKEYKMPKLCYLDSIVSVVDAKRLSDEFNNGDNLLKDNIDEDDLENPVIQQIEFCNVILLNKVDELSKDELNKVKSVIKTIQPTAEIIETNYSKVEPSCILEGRKFDFDKVATSSGWFNALENVEDEEDGETLEYGINTFVYFSREPFDRQKFYDYIAKPWSKKIIRTKGITYFKDDKDMSYLFESAGKMKDLSEAGLWLAAESPKYRDEVLKANPDLQKDWDPFYGDRMTKIVFIGQDISKEEISKELDDLR